MLAVLCTDSELAEEGEVLSVGDQVARLAVTATPDFYGTDLDRIEWVLDRYAQVASGGRRIAEISGTIASIDAIYVALSLNLTGWAPAAGTATLERLETTTATRRPERRIAWGPTVAMDAQGRATRAGYPVLEEGDEHFSGWVITLAEERVRLMD